ncbi:ParA family protein (plasmid) [Rhodovastum atsumiense]|uniref:ParA family protein n=1 Tax=Rhodovastum atsumiense TaxID=504468 RepID=A0A5M6IMZ6_9PROT|nr:ParA family protein [Rhodovastum atsumiense]KAA5609630.1 ParA family protein [Rhodovastum atsumiense]CAH2606493.1 ParA family protein [Rhodovastum atsumiense]
MHVIVVASQKGGVGKTTLAAHLAVHADRNGTRTALIDTDPQGGLAGWWNARAAETPSFFRVDGPLQSALDGLQAAGFGAVIIDTPPAITASIAATIAVADLVLVPAKPSPQDLRAVGATVDLVRAEGRQMLFVVNMCIQRARLNEDARAALSEHGPVAPGLLFNRVAYVNAMIDGRTAGEVEPRGEAAREISELWAFLAGAMAGREMRHVAAAG